MTPYIPLATGNWPTTNESDLVEKRADGLEIRWSEVIGSWIVTSADGKHSISHCPCCTRPILAKASARLVADAVFPEEADHAV